MFIKVNVAAPTSCNCKRIVSSYDRFMYKYIYIYIYFFFSPIFFLLFSQVFYAPKSLGFEVSHSH